MMQRMRAAAVQLSSTPDRDRNLEAADRLTREAAARGAELVVLPEKWPVLGTPEQTAAGAEPLDGPSLTWARGVGARAGDRPRRGLDRRGASPAPSRGANTCVHVGPDGEDRAIYRKIHMFDVEVGGRAYRESEHEAPGDEPALSATADGTGLGLTICYDLRFPELYRLLATEGAKRAHGLRRVHGDDDARALGGPAARAGDRGPVLRDRVEPDRRARAGHPLRRPQR